MQKCRPAYARLKRDIRGTAPDFRPFTAGQDASSYTPPVFEPESAAQSDSDSDNDGEPAEAPMNLDDVRKHIQR